MSTKNKPILSNQQIADFMEQSQERGALRYREQFRQEQMAIYKDRLKKKAEKEAAKSENTPSAEQAPG